MPRISWQKVLENKYNYLLTIELFLLVALPLLHAIQTRFPLTSALLFIGVVPALYVCLSRPKFWATLSLGVFILLMHIVATYQAAQLSERAWMLLLLLYAVFFLLTIIIIIGKISSMKVVTADTVKGGISVYILIGLLWSIFYMMLALYDPAAFANLSSDSRRASFELFYYSFTTLTTLGYGDISPLSVYAKTLAILEAITGPVYLAIFIAQLVGINIAQKLTEKSGD
jgi:hypothetical protein